MIKPDLSGVPSAGRGAATGLRRLLRCAPPALLAVAMLVTPAVASPVRSAIASASADACPAVQVVFARGTGEAPGAGRVGDAFADALRSQVGGQSVAVYGVNYPASDDFLKAVDGANDASAFVQNVAATCPDTKIVLGGYSQGAAVVDIITVAGRPVFGFGDPMPPGVASHVAAVAVFGNPSNRFGGPLTALSPVYGPKTIDLCTTGDPVCSDGNDVSAHSLYVQSGLASQAATFVADRLSAASSAA
jgi:cutinase